MGTLNIQPTIISPPVNGTDGREACSKFWIAAYTKPNCERKAAQLLESLGIEVYIPVQQEVHQWSDRKKKIDRIVIPMTIFAKIEDEQEKIVSRSNLVLRTLSMPGLRKAHHIPDNQIERLKFVLGHSDTPVEFVPNAPKVGDKIRIVRGNLMGVEGIAITDSEGNKEILISIDLLGGARMSIDTIEVEVIKI